MGLIVNIYRHNSESWLTKGNDAPNGGISSKVEKLTLLNVAGPFEPSVNAPAAMLKASTIGSRKHPYIEPVTVTKSGDLLEIKGGMFGGNYAGTSDSRFGEAVEKLIGHKYGPVGIHDRVER